MLTYFAAEHLIVSSYWSTQLPVDNLIPFCRFFILPYSTWYPLLIWVGIYLLCRDEDGFRRYMGFLAVTFFLSELIWLLFPNGQDLRPALVGGNDLCTWMVRGLYRIDTNTNVFPSVHVVGAIGAALAVWRCPNLQDRRKLRLGIAVLSALICLATLFIKQHSVLDVLGGCAVAFPCGLVFYRKSAPVLVQ
mgnify:CR=1 FL=1